ncbi:hypothetical protein VTO42DRAFT_2040 [Malbranchea cinnamomea]
MVLKPEIPPGTLHAAGIYADMSVDGPEIGTLVVVVDRAKNLPNRKTMGKQNPYCAARLGKEAKKTGTDIRGGQTPKWDQELRFTVHESPDYYRLKVSVFNDDKKTDLIGETWIDLKNVVMPGGGQNDQWYNLQFKGKYAGEIRMEMTYYDTRPKDEAVIERRREAERKEAKAEARHAGSRHAKHTKRRPLPADPTSTSSSRPSHSEHKLKGPRSNDPRPTNPPPQPQKVPEQIPKAQVPRPHSSHKYETPDDLHRQWAIPNAHSTANGPIPMPDPRDSYQQPPLDSYIPSRPVPMHMPAEFTYPPSHDYLQGRRPIDRHAPEPHDPYYSRDYNVSHSRDAYDATPRHSIEQPDKMAPGLRHGMENSYTQTNGSAHDPRNMSDRYPAHPPSFRENESQYNPSSRGDFPRREYVQPHFHDEPDEEGPPPPPPVHRHGVSRPAPVQERPATKDAGPIPMPEPLNISPGRNAPNIQSGSDAPQTYLAYSPNHANSSFPSAENVPPYSTSPAPSYHSSNERPSSRGRPSTANGEPVPAPLVAGYNPSVVDESEEMTAEYQQYNSVPAQTVPHHQTMRASPVGVSAERPSSSRSVQDPRHVIPRKSVSPQPQPQHNPDSLPGVPFSPDSYDILNPNAANAVAVQQPAANYSSPAEAMEAARQHEVDKMRALGPIVGNDGRVIDPSDHLPSDTWAPEPERKSRKPEVVLRFKHANTAGPRPPPKEQQPVTPRSRHIPNYPATPQHSVPGHGSPSPASHSERRGLQKRPQSYVQPNSAHSPSPRGNPPLRERDNFDVHTPPHQPPPYSSREPSPSPASRYSASTSTTLNTSPYYAPPIGPPVPAKVPIHPAPDSGSIDPLSEEMRRIDIGSTSSKGTVGRKGRHSYAGVH